MLSLGDQRNSFNPCNYSFYNMPSKPFPLLRDVSLHKGFHSFTSDEQITEPSVCQRNSHDHQYICNFYNTASKVLGLKAPLITMQNDRLQYGNPNPSLSEAHATAKYPQAARSYAKR